MANPIIADGEYYILNAANPAMALDVSASSLKKANAKIQVWGILKNNAQAWQIRNVGEGGNVVALTSRLYGNRIGPASTSSTAEIKLNVTGNGVPNNVTFSIAEASGTTTYGGTAYQNYTIKCGSYNMYASGTTAGSTVRVSTSTATQAQWIFVPIDQLEAGGVFEIRPAIDTKMALDVQNFGLINGSNLQIWLAAHTNNQIFAIRKESDGFYSIRDINSGRYIDVDSAIAANGRNVQIFEDNDTRAQRWNVLEYGKMTVDGTECNIVSFGSCVTTGGADYMMDVCGASNKLNTNVQIWETNHAQQQRFALYPTTAEDANMPVPYSIGISNGYGAGKQYGYSGNDNHITWSCSAAWCTDNGSNHYEMRYRTRSMSPTTSSWRSWSDWTAWEIPDIETSGQQAWRTDSIDAAFEYSESKHNQIEVQIRSVGAEELALLHSKPATQVIDIYKQPIVTIPDVGWTPEGMRVGLASNYEYGTTYVKVVGIRIDGKQAFVGDPVTHGFVGDESSFIVPRDRITAAANDGSAVEFDYITGYDQQQVGDKATHVQTDITFDAGSVSVEPTFTRDGLHLYAHVKRLGSGANLGTSQLWVEHNNQVVECPLVEQTYTEDIYEVLYPTNGDTCNVFTDAWSLDKSIWGTDISTINFPHIAYAWTVGNETLYLDTFLEEAGTYAHDHAATYQVDLLDSRAQASVSFAPTQTTEHTAYGSIPVEDRDRTASVEEFEALVGTHAIFRDIKGGICNVAVTNVSVSQDEISDNITVNMIEETV